MTKLIEITIVYLKRAFLAVGCEPIFKNQEHNVAPPYPALYERPVVVCPPGGFLFE